MTNAHSYDFIGDIHGHAAELRNLLERLGYHSIGTGYTHPEGRQAIFLGDYIDRGPEILATLRLVRAMTENGDAQAILGNHEVNALRYATRGPGGEPLRPHTPNNVKQHRDTLEQIPDPVEWRFWLDWFESLPMYLDLKSARAIHAAWDDRSIALIQAAGSTGTITVDGAGAIKGSSLHTAISTTLNGPEGQLPAGLEHVTFDGRRRTEFRTKWWIDLDGLTCRQAIFPDSENVPELSPRYVPNVSPYPAEAPPTFFGHYSCKDRIPQPLAPNLACLDYGMGKGGILCAYRWDGESTIDPRKFTSVQADRGALVA